MADYSVLCENQQIEIGKAGENLARSCTIDYSAWLKEYGEGDLRIRAIRSGDAEPYPVTNVTTENGVATWIFTDADTAIKGYGEVQILYYVEDVLVKSRVWRTYTHRSLSTSSEEVPDPYQDWLSEVERIGSQIEEDAESASDSATRAAGSASEAAESALSATRSESSAQEYASAASSSADSAASSATAASRSATEASNYEYNSEQYMNEAKSAKFGAESARTGAENAKAAAQASATAAAQSAEQAEETAESIEESADLIQKLLANQIHDTATGTIATYPDGADMPMVSLIADIDPIQDTSGGAPSPSHICPISGWDEVETVVSGKNVLVNDVESGSSNGVTWVVNEDKSLSLSGTATANAFIILSDLHYLVSGQYTMTASGNANIQMLLRVNDASGSNAIQATTTNVTRTIASGMYVGLIRIANGTNTDEIVLYPQLELGATATSYEPYQGQTYRTTLPQTVYGGTLDVVSGVLTVDRAMVDLGSLTWSKRVSGVFYTWSLQNLVKAVSNNSQTANTKCSALKLGSYSDVYNNATLDYAISVGADSQLGAHCSAYAEAADFKSAMSGVQLVYELATPQTYQLTPTQIDSLLGLNNVWADSGDVTVEYIADTKLYIQKVMGAIG